MSATGGAKATGGGTSASVLTWTQLYNNYFGAGTAGNCTSCHASGNPKFSSASTMCTALKNAGYIGPGGMSFLLTWFGQTGSMPINNNPTPPNAVADLTAWENAGAVCP
jgi:hypothetical protein